MCPQSEGLPSVLFATCIISVLESIAWILITIFAILKFQCVFPTPKYTSNGFIYTTLYKFYLEGEECKVEANPPDYPDIGKVGLTKPSEVHSWMIAYLITSLIMFLISVNLFKNKINEILKVKLIIWSSVVGVILVMDIILTCFFVRDFFRLQDYLAGKDPKNIGSIPIVMFVLSAKGFALWLVNFCLVLYYVLWLKNSPITENEMGKEDAREIVKAYDNYGFNNSSESEKYGKLKIFDTTSYDHSSLQRTFENHDNRRLSADSFEAVTPFNMKEYVPVSVEKQNFIVNKNRFPESENFCCEQGSDGTIFHGHSCSRLKSELEMKLQTYRKKTEQKSSILSDFSHNLKNFKRGSGKIGQYSENLPQRKIIPNKSPTPLVRISDDYGFY